MFRTGCVDTLQATVIMPYAGTPLYKEAEKNGWLLTKDWDDYDMRRPILKSPLTPEDTLALTQDLYNSFISPQFVWNKLRQHPQLGRRAVHRPRHQVRVGSSHRLQSRASEGRGRAREIRKNGTREHRRRCLSTGREDTCNRWRRLHRQLRRGPACLRRAPAFASTKSRTASPS